MPAIAIIGAQWGDEGKGKIVDLLAGRARMVVRFSGGNNAGHTVINPYGEFRMHLVPSGIFHPQVISVIGNGVVVDPPTLLEEMGLLEKAGVSLGNLLISQRAHLIMPYHVLQDGLEEEARGQGAIGTTRRGIGPAYTDKVARLGLRMGDLLDVSLFRERLEAVVEYKNRLFTRVYGADPLSTDEIFQRYCQYRTRLAPHIQETEARIQEVLEKGGLVLMEGAQGTLLDLEFGTYPYVTSCTTTAGGVSPGLGLPPTGLTGILGVFKAYVTRVGGGPMPTELRDQVGETIRERAHEYGATTGRPRRCGWFDAVAGRFATRVNGFTAAVITRLDVLDAFPAIKVCTAYRKDGETLTGFPASAEVLARCQPVYEELSGWQADTTAARSFQDLPPNAQAYLRRLQQLIACPIKLISVGPSREQVVVVDGVV